VLWTGHQTLVGQSIQLWEDVHDIRVIQPGGDFVCELPSPSQARHEHHDGSAHRLMESGEHRRLGRVEDRVAYRSPVADMGISKVL
jgi:hypothetical protein